MRIRILIFSFFLISTDCFSQNTPVLTNIPSTVADSTGIALLIYYPDSARYDTCGAPIAIVVAGGKGATGIILNYSAVIAHFGFIQVFFHFPGGGIGPILSGGTYDLRGPDCIAALKDVIKFCSGETTNNNGKYLNELVPVAPNYENVGLVGGSNGGNISFAVAGIYGNQLPGLKWICNWETPVGDGNILADMGNTNFGSSAPTSNLAYNDTTGVFDYSKLKYCDTLYFNYNLTFDTLAGFYFDNDNNDNPNDSVDYKLEPLIYGSGISERAYYSQKIIELGFSLGLIPNPKPFYIPTFQEAKDFWKWRNGEYWMDSISLKRPDILFMITAKNNDHYINSPDHPGILNQYLKFVTNQTNLPRLNPDKSYLEYVMDSVYPGLPDNACYTPYNRITIRDVLIPDSVDQKLLYAAGACELADRSIRGDFRWQLDSVYDNCEKYIAHYSDSTDTDEFSESDSAAIALTINSFSNSAIQSKLFPNPSSSYATLIIYSADNEEVKIKLTDLSGRVILISVEKLKSGNNSIQLKSTALENGIYFLTIQNKTRIETLKLEVLH